MPDLTAGKTYYSDSDYNSTYTAPKAFDDNSSTRWSSASSDLPHWIAVDLGAKKVVVRLAFTPYSGQCKDFKLQGSNDSTNGSDGSWTDLLIDLSVTSAVKQEFPVPNTEGYQWYRLLVTSKYGTDNLAVSLYEIEMFDTVSLMPPMTADNAPSPYVVSLSSATYSGRQVYQAFDKDTSTAMLSASGNPTGILTIDLGVDNAQAVQGYTILPYHIASTQARSPKDWTFEASNNGTDWTVLDTQAGITGWAKGEVKEYAVTNTTAYRYYRLNVTANGGDTSYWGLTEFTLLRLIEPYTPPPQSEGVLFATFI